MRSGTAWRTTLGIVFMGIIMAGCASQAPAPPKAQIAEDKYAEVKSEYLAANPGARLGRVVAVLPDQDRLSVGDIPLGDFRKGDVISVVDDDLHSLATGAVVDIDTDYLYVQYTPSTTGSRAPAVGDMAIRAETPTR